MNIDELKYKELKEIANLFGDITPKKKRGESAFESLIGKQVTFFCLNYIYHGEIASYDDESVKIKNPKIVYETGAFDKSGFEDSQELKCTEFNIKRKAIESFGVLDKKND